VLNWTKLTLHNTWKINRATLIIIYCNLLFAHMMMSHRLSCRMKMGGICEFLEGKIWEWDLSFRLEWEWDGNIPIPKLMKWEGIGTKNMSPHISALELPHQSYEHWHILRPSVSSPVISVNPRQTRRGHPACSSTESANPCCLSSPRERQEWNQVILSVFLSRSGI